MALRYYLIVPVIVLFQASPALAQGNDISGTWQFRFEITKAGGICSGDVGAMGLETTTLSHNVQTGEVTVSGGGDQDLVSISGVFEENTLTYSGFVPEDGGYTFRSVTLALNEDGTELSGIEKWTWGFSKEDQTACPDSEASIVAEKISDGEPDSTTYSPPILSFSEEMDRLMRESDTGRRWLDLYYRFRYELFLLFLTIPELGGTDSETSIASDGFERVESETVSASIGGGAILDAFEAIKPGFASVLVGEGEQALISQDMVDKMKSVKTLIIDNASESLKSAIETEEQSLADFDDFVGMNFDELTMMMGVDPENLRIFAFNPEIDETSFSVSARQIDGLEYSLWRSVDLKPDSWALVEDAVLDQSETEVTLTDLSPSKDFPFYRLQRVASSSSESE